MTFNISHVMKTSELKTWKCNVSLKEKEEMKCSIREVKRTQFHSSKHHPIDNIYDPNFLWLTALKKEQKKKLAGETISGFSPLQLIILLTVYELQMHVREFLKICLSKGFSDGGGWLFGSLWSKLQERRKESIAF